MAKKVMGQIKLQVPAGAANPSPPIGPALGQRGLNIMEFCKTFNARTQEMEKGMPIPVIITYYQDKSFSLEMKTPPASFLLKKAAKIDGGSKKPGLEPKGSVTQADLKQDRRVEDEGPERERYRRRDEDHRRLRAFDGPRGQRVSAMADKKKAPKEGKRLAAARKGVDSRKQYALAEAVKMVKERAKAKFDETIEVAMNLGVDPRHADQMVRGVVNLPNGTGKTLRVAVFAKGAKADEAKKAGADIVGEQDLFDTVNGGKIDFDRLIATPDMMGLVGRLGKVLGPRGLMPNPKVGTVTMDVTKAVKDAKGGAVEFRAEKAGIIHAGVGKASFTRSRAGREHPRALRLAS